MDLLEICFITSSLLKTPTARQGRPTEKQNSNRRCQGRMIAACQPAICAYSGWRLLLSDSPRDPNEKSNSPNVSDGVDS